MKVPRREICIATRGTKDGTTVYINKQACSGELFPLTTSEIFFPGVTVSEQYRRGSTGTTGDKGLSSAAASCPTLDPRDNDVLRLSCRDADGFKRLLDWYAGRLSAAPLDTQSINASQEVRKALLAASTDASHSQRSTSELLDYSTEPSSADDEATDEIAPDITQSDEVRLLLDPRRRQAVERWAVDLAKAAYWKSGFHVEELGKPFDLLCTPTERCAPDVPVVHVEVKGSIGPASSVHLTRNEVLDARVVDKTWRTDLFIVSEICLDEVDAMIVASKGRTRCIENWTPADKDLIATDFVYRVPPLDE